MRNKKRFVFDEEAEAESILLNGFPDGKIDYSQMYTVAKYFRQTFRYGELRLERALIKFCKEQDANFNPVIEAESIKKWIKTAMCYGLRKIGTISLSKKEIEFLKEIPIIKERKVLFVTLVFAKALKESSTRLKRKPSLTQKNLANEFYYIHYSNLLDIIHLSGIKSLTETRLAYIFNKHKSSFTFYNPEKELIRVDYASPESETVFVIENPDKVMEEYEIVFGGKNNCAKCGEPFERKSNRQKYCPLCQIEINREQSKTRMKKRYKNLTL